MLVRSGQQEGLIPSQPMEARQDIGADRRVDVAQMGSALG